MKDGLTPVTNQNVSGSVSNNLSKLEKEHYALQQYVRRNNVEILGLPDIFTGDRLTEKVVELCNDVGIVVEVRDIKPCHRLFQKESYNQLPNTTWKVSRVILSYSGPHFPSFRLNMEILHIFPYSVQMRENAEQNNSEYGHLLRSAKELL